jgi:chemotaxis protein histidine kinase CheA
MMSEEYMDAQMLCNAFVDEVVTQIKDIKEQSLQMERPHYDKEFLDSIFKTAETIKEDVNSFDPETICDFIHAAEMLLDLVPRERLALHEPAIALLLDTASLIKKTMDHLPSATAP